eukprot:scaffold124492_cov73-Phaeocystis_antarctica.AAC.2
MISVVRWRSPTMHCSTEHVVASPAAAVLERRLSRTTPEKRKLPCGDSVSEGSETGSDGEWSGDDDPLRVTTVARG